PTVAHRLEPARKHATHLRPFLAAVYSGNLLLNILMVDLEGCPSGT
ncbi:hypothetical protein LEMLEM_LOCUS8730, partial [Lemmus lemmus]